MHKVSMKEQIAKLRYESLVRTVKENQKTPAKSIHNIPRLGELVAGLNCGAIRQAVMMDWFKQYDSDLNGEVHGYVQLAINRRWCWNTKDKDLQDLLKSGFLKMTRSHIGGRANCTYLTWSGK